MLNNVGQAGTGAWICITDDFYYVQPIFCQTNVVCSLNLSQMEFQIILAHGAMGADASDTILDTFLREFSEKHQEEGEWAEKYGTCFQSDKILMQRYCWCEKEKCPYCWSFEDGKPTKEQIEKFGMSENETAPNFWYKPLDFKVWWYKYIGRGVHVNKQLSTNDFSKMVADCMSL